MGYLEPQGLGCPSSASSSFSAVTSGPASGSAACAFWVAVKELNLNYHILDI